MTQLCIGFAFPAARKHPLNLTVAKFIGFH
jgi:hypothetical protein